MVSTAHDVNMQNNYNMDKINNTTYSSIQHI